jgi:hypothetical protein
MRVIIGALLVCIASDRGAATEPTGADKIARTQQRIASIAARLLPPGGPWIVHPGETYGPESQYAWRIEEGDARGEQTQVLARVFASAEEASEYLEKINDSSQMRAVTKCKDITEQCLTLAGGSSARRTCRSYRVAIDNVFLALSGCDSDDKLAQAFMRMWAVELKRESEK